jgi:hypothetical protein
MYGLTMERRGLLGSIVGLVCRVFAGFVTVGMLLVPDQGLRRAVWVCSSSRGLDGSALLEVLAL